MLFKGNKKLTLFCLLFVFVVLIQANAQEQREEEDWIPSMLQSKTSIYLQLLQYNGYGIGWKYRGSKRASLLSINGMEWSSDKLGFDMNAAFLGLNSIYRTAAISTGYDPNENGLSSSVISHFANLNASHFSKNISLSSRYQPLNGLVQNNLFWSSGKSHESWFIVAKIQNEQNYMTNPALGLRTNQGVALSINKLLAKKQQISFSFWFNNRFQTKQTTSTKEAILLSGNSIYHPGWGWTHGQILFPFTKSSQLPFGLLQYDKMIDTRTHLQLNWAFAMGRQSNDGLEWTSVRDPRPDYYKYMPSYYQDSTLKNQLIQLYQQNPSLLQINFDEMEKINSSNREKRSFYIINRQIVEINIFQQSFKYQFDLSERIQFAFHSNSIFEKVEKHSQVASLLGGNYFLNYNSWVSDDGASSFQFDLKHPDKQIKKGQDWGAHYSISNFDQQFGLFVFWQSPKIESNVGLGYGIAYFQRQGFNQNGLFPDQSFGLSPRYFFPSQKLQWSLVYKSSPRHYLKFNTFFHQDAPSWNMAFKNVSLIDELSEYLLPIIKKGVNIGIHFIGINFKSELELYLFQEQNQYDRQSFYHDYYNAFVQANYGLLNKAQYGVEWGLETSFNSIFNIQYGFSFGKNKILNNPIYSIQLLNGNYPLESGNLHLKNLPALQSPEMIMALGMNAQLSSSCRLSLTSIFAWNRFLELDYFRRSFLWDKSTSDIQALQNGVMSNFLMSKNFLFKSKKSNHRLGFYLQVNNIFNTIIPLFAYEQSRYDYKTFDQLKFAPKYLYGLPRNGSIQLIYQFN